MTSHYLTIPLALLVVCVLSYKINADESVLIDPNTCSIPLLSHEDALSVLSTAIEQDDIDKLLTFKTMTWYLHTSYQNGHYLLHQAASLGKIDAIHTLVSELEVDINIQDPKTGWTALHYAAFYITDRLSRINTVLYSYHTWS